MQVVPSGAVTPSSDIAVGAPSGCRIDICRGPRTVFLRARVAAARRNSGFEFLLPEECVRHLARGLITGVAAATIVATGLPQPASAVQPAPDGSTAEQAAAAAHRPDNRPGPLTRIFDARRKAAMTKIAKGKAVPDADGIVALGKGRFVQLSPPKNDTIFTILADFGTQTINKYGTAPGPVHNSIPEPDRSVDNAT